MTHGSETEGRLSGFLQKDASARSPEERFNRAPMSLDAQTLDADVEKLKQTTNFNTSQATRFGGLPRFDGKNPDTRPRSSAAGGAFAALFTISLTVTFALLAAAEILRATEFYLLGAIAALITALIGIAATLLNPPRV